jgi:hypothetical protein
MGIGHSRAINHSPVLRAKTFKNSLPCLYLPMTLMPCTQGLWALHFDNTAFQSILQRNSVSSHPSYSEVRRYIFVLRWPYDHRIADEHLFVFVLCASLRWPNSIALFFEGLHVFLSMASRKNLRKNRYSYQ